MKILQVNCVYGSGSTGRIVSALHESLVSQGAESLVCYGRGRRCREEQVYKTCGELAAKCNHLLAKLRGVQYGGCPLSTGYLISRIRKEKPDVVHLHCLNGYFVNIYRLIAWLRENHIPTVLTLHAEFLYTGGCSHAENCNQWRTGCGQARCPALRRDIRPWFFDRTGLMWRKLYRAFQGDWPELRVVSVSAWLKGRAESAPILEGKRHYVIWNGVDRAIFRPCGKAAADRNRKALGLKHQKIVFHATACFDDDPHHGKGGYYILELAKRMPEVRFLVAGRLQGRFSVPENVTLLGHVRDASCLAQLYSLADVTLLTSRRETFSLVTAESLCCGTPVAGFLAGGPEEIALPRYSAFGAYGDLDMLQSNTERFLSGQWDKGEIAEAAAIYDQQKMVQQYRHLYRALSGGKEWAAYENPFEEDPILKTPF